jgi:hypothetical protein
MYWQLVSAWLSWFVYPKQCNRNNPRSHSPHRGREDSHHLSTPTPARGQTYKLRNKIIFTNSFSAVNAAPCKGGSLARTPLLRYCSWYNRLTYMWLAVIRRTILCMVQTVLPHPSDVAYLYCYPIGCTVRWYYMVSRTPLADITQTHTSPDTRERSSLINTDINRYLVISAAAIDASYSWLASAITKRRRTVGEGGG